MKEVDFMEQLRVTPASLSSVKVGKKKDEANMPHQPTKCQTTGLIPCRTTPKWVQNYPVVIDAKKHLELIAEGKLPLGLLPQGAPLPDDQYRKGGEQRLQAISTAKYDNTSTE